MITKVGLDWNNLETNYRMLHSKFYYLSRCCSCLESINLEGYLLSTSIELHIPGDVENYRVGFRLVSP